MYGSLDGKVALVTGAAGGIGEACVRALAEAGAKVMATDIDGEIVERVAGDMRERGLDVAALQQNVADESHWQRVVDTTVAQFGGLEVLVNNAGIDDGMLLGTDSLDTVRRLYQVNVESIFLGMKYAADVMKPGGSSGRGGAIINLSSVAAMIGAPGHSAYGATKGAVRAYTKHAAVEFGALGYGIRVNSVHPGLIETDMGNRVIEDFVSLGLADSVEGARDLLNSMTALGQLGHVDDVANMVRFLASDSSRYVTGAEFVVDGGMTAR